VVVVSPHVGLRSQSVLGGEVYERALLTRLPRYGIQLELGLPRSLAPPDPMEGWHITLLRPSRGLRWYIAPSAFVPFTIRQLRTGHVDLLRGHSVRFIGPSLLAARRFVRADVPIILHHLHTDRGWERIEGPILRQADAVITISETSRAQLLRFGVEPEKITVIAPGVDPPMIQAPLGQNPWPDSPDLRILFAGRLVPRKRPDIALRCLAELPRLGVEAFLVVAGDGPLRPGLEKLARDLGIAKRVCWWGVFSPAEKWALYDSADVLLFPSELEGFGFVAAEAQTRGLPTIVAADTAGREVIIDGETGFSVRGEPESFADAVGRLADEALRKRMSERAVVCASRFSWDTSARAVAEEYRRIVAGRPAR
jgi:glycosyltransferase involved in cell wall biosynthesis